MLLSGIQHSDSCMRALEKEMATHSRILAWRVPGTEDPGGLLAMGSHRQRGTQQASAPQNCVSLPRRTWGGALS